MILFATLKMIIFLGKWALYKMIPNFDKNELCDQFCGSNVTIRHWLQ